MPKPRAGNTHFAAAHQLDEIVVAPAAGYRPKLALPVERLKDDARVIGQAANDLVVNLHVVPQPPRLQVAHNGPQLRGGLAFLDEGGNGASREAHAAQLLVALLGRLSFQLVYDLEELVFPGRITVVLEEEVVPGITAAEPNDEVLRGQSERAERINQQGDQLGICGRIGLTDNVGVELEVLPQNVLSAGARNGRAGGRRTI